MSLIRDRERGTGVSFNWKAYGFSLLLTAAALAATYALKPWLGERIYLLPLTAVFVSGWYGGLGPGLLATACSILGGGYFLLRPLQSLGIENVADVLALVLFVLAAVVSSTLNDRLRSAQHLATASARREREAVIAAQRSAEELRSNQRELSDFFEESAVALHWVGPDGTILRANRAELELLGYAHEDYVGRDIREFHADPPVIEDMLARLSKGEALRDYSARLRCKDGSIKHVVIDANVRWEKGQFIHTRGFTRDVSERRKLDSLRALHFEVTRILAESRTVEEVGKRILGQICEQLDWTVGELWMIDPVSDVMRCSEIWTRSDRPVPAFEAETRARSFPHGIGLPGRIWSTRTPSWIPDVTLDPNFPRKAAAAKDGLHSGCGFPILRRGEAIGVFEFFCQEPRAPDEELMKFLADVGHRIGQFSERKRSEQRLQLLSEVSSILSSSLEYSGTIDKVAHLLVPALADHCFVHLLEEGEVRLVSGVSKESRSDGMKASPEAALPRVLQVLREGKPRLVPDILDSGQFEAAPVDDTQPGFRFPSFSEVCVPLLVRGRTIGALTLGRFHPRPPFGAGDFLLARELARRCATALDNARLHEAERKSRREAEEALGHVSELHAITAQLATALTPSDVGRIILEMASAETEASAGAVFALAETGRALQLVHSVGFDGDVSESFGRLSMEEASPLTDAIRAGTTLWVDSGAPPHPRFPAPGETCGAWGVIPLMVGSRVLGGVVLAVARVPRFAEQEQSYMFAQTTQCALAFERSLLFREVQQASAEKTRFLAAISHDLRTPVNAVLLLSSLVRKDAEALGLSDGAKLLERCRRIESAATSFAELLNNLLDISSLEVGHKRMKEENFFLAEVLAECAATLRGLAKAKGLALNVRCHDARLGLRADRTELTRVLMNLVGNAIKFTETGSVAVDTGRSPEGGLWIRVEDTGPGISGEYLPYLFNEFFQIENKERSRVQGSGLGLAISFRIMRALDGELRVDTEPGKGSVFTVILPAPRVLSEMEDQPDTLGLERTRPTRPKGSLLIIDDDLVFTEALAEILKESGYSVRVADRGDDGLELLAKEKSDVVLLDMMMPGIDGVDVIRRIRSQPALKHTRIIVLTGDVTRERTQAVQAAGADAFLGKPLQVPALLATIRKEMEGAEDPRVSRAALRRTTVPPVR